MLSVANAPRQRGSKPTMRMPLDRVGVVIRVFRGLAFPRSADTAALAAHAGKRGVHSSPVATGRVRSLTQPLHDGAYKREPARPACSIASRLWQAVTPEPHMCTTADGARAPSTARKSRFSSSALLKR